MTIVSSSWCVSPSFFFFFCVCDCATAIVDSSTQSQQDTSRVGIQKERGGGGARGGEVIVNVVVTGLYSLLIWTYGFAVGCRVRTQPCCCVAAASSLQTIQTMVLSTAGNSFVPFSLFFFFYRSAPAFTLLFAYSTLLLKKESEISSSASLSPPLYVYAVAAEVAI